MLFRDWDRIVCIVGRGGDGDRAQRERMCRPNLGQVCVVGGVQVITPTQCREVCAVIRANWFPGHTEGEGNHLKEKAVCVCAQIRVIIAGEQSGQLSTAKFSQNIPCRVRCPAVDWLKTHNS